MPRRTLASLTTLRLGGPTGDMLTISDPSDWPDLAHTISRHDQGAP